MELDGGKATLDIDYENKVVRVCGKSVFAALGRFVVKVDDTTISSFNFDGKCVRLEEQQLRKIEAGSSFSVSSQSNPALSISMGSGYLIDILSFMTYLKWKEFDS